MIETMPDIKHMRGEIKEFLTAKEALVAATMAINVVDEETNLQASKFLSSALVPLRKKIEGKRQQYSTSLRRMATEWDKEFTPALQAIDGLIGYLKEGMLAWTRIKQEEARLLQAELDRMAEEDRKAAEARGELSQIPEDVAALAPAVQTTTKTQNGTTTIAKHPYLDIYDEAKLPRQYLIPDRSKILEDVRAGIEVPGAKLAYREQVSIRAK